MSALLEPRFTLGEWSRIFVDPTRDKAYQRVTRLGDAVARYLAWKRHEAAASTLAKYELYLATLCWHVAANHGDPEIDAVTADMLLEAADKHPIGSYKVVRDAHKSPLLALKPPAALPVSPESGIASEAINACSTADSKHAPRVALDFVTRPVPSTGDAKTPSPGPQLQPGGSHSSGRPHRRHRGSTRLRLTRTRVRLPAGSEALVGTSVNTGRLVSRRSLHPFARIRELAHLQPAICERVPIHAWDLDQRRRVGVDLGVGFAQGAAVPGVGCVASRPPVVAGMAEHLEGVRG